MPNDPQITPVSLAVPVPDLPKPSANSTSEILPETSPSDASKINPKIISNEAERENAMKVITAWENKIEEDVSKIFRENNIKVFTVCFIHHGTATPMMFSSVNTYLSARLSALVSKTLREKVSAELMGIEGINQEKVN